MKTPRSSALLLWLAGAMAIGGCQGGGAAALNDPDWGICDIQPTQTVRLAGKATLAPGWIWEGWSGEIRYGPCGDILGNPGSSKSAGHFSLAPEGTFAREFKADCDLLSFTYGGYWVEIKFWVTDPERPGRLFVRTLSSANMDAAACRQGQWSVAMDLDIPR